MTSNIFSRLAGGRSMYESLHDPQNDDLDEEQHLGFDIDEENLNQNFQDYDVDHAGLADSRTTVQSHRDPVPGPSAAAWHEDDGDNEVPASLLWETEGQTHTHPGQPMKRNDRRLPQPRQTPVPGLSTKRSREQWETTQTHQRLHRDETASSAGLPLHGISQVPMPVGRGVQSGSKKQRTLWKWANVSNMDAFLHDVYYYYRNGGMWCLVLARVLAVVQGIFTATFLTFLIQCVDYDKLPQSQKLSQIVIPQCTRNMSTKWNILLWVWAFYIVAKIAQYGADMRRLLWMRDFYTLLLDIPDSDMQTISWQDVVARFMALRDANPNVATNLTAQQRKFLGGHSKERVDAHDIANRLMRKENYIIALFNKDLLDLSLPVPFLRNYQFCSASLEFWLWTSIIGFVFNTRGEVGQEFLKADRRGQLSQKLRERFIFYGVLSLVFAPGYFFHQFFLHLFMNFNEYRSNASSLMGERAYSPFALWKFREFNELEHIFRDRLNMSYPFANRYVDQFPKIRTEHLAQTVVFISGALVAVLALATMLDPEMFLSFEITTDRTALFYITILGSVFATARGMLSAESKVFDPEYAMRQVIEYTHYEPDHWKSRLHGFDVKKEFSNLYKPRFFIFLEELLGILVTPFVLWFSLPKCSDQIIDFFREFTIHVDGVGYVCTFAEFDFKRGVPGSQKAIEAGGDVRDDYYSTKYGKMAASYYNFLDNYVVNPKTGIPGHPGGRHQFHPPPSFPGLQSPTLAADMQSSHMGGRNERPRSRGPVPARTPRFGPVVPASPMASMLLDPHHQPTMGYHGRSGPHARTGRSGYVGDEIIEEAEDGEDSVTVRRYQDQDSEGTTGNLGESSWETSPIKGLSREDSGARSEEDAPGVLGLLNQLQQAHKDLSARR